MTKALPEIYYVDHSILATGDACQEKQRLAYVEHLAPPKEGDPLIFGSAWHAGRASLYESYFRKEDMETSIRSAKQAFVDYCRREDGTFSLPKTSENERRSIEKGLKMLEAYAEHWHVDDIQWTPVTYKDENGEPKPYIEVGFACYLMHWRGIPVVMVGKIDEVRQHNGHKAIYNMEAKSTTSNIKSYALQTRPNHQISTYHWAFETLTGIRPLGTKLDVAFINDRKIGGKFQDGVNPGEDFARYETQRSPRDIEEWKYDTELAVDQFLSNQQRDGRWRRSAPAACTAYSSGGKGGCYFRAICNSNGNPQITKSQFIIRKWEPWNNIIETSTKNLTVISNVLEHV